jgi:hypothetical protein
MLPAVDVDGPAGRWVRAWLVVWRCVNDGTAWSVIALAVGAPKPLMAEATTTAAPSAMVPVSRRRPFRGLTSGRQAVWRRRTMLIAYVARKSAR